MPPGCPAPPPGRCEALRATGPAGGSVAVRNSLVRRDRLLLPVDGRQGLERHHVDRLLARPPRPAPLPELTEWAARLRRAGARPGARRR